MELVIKILAVVIVLSILSVLLWSYVARTQAEIAAETTPQPIYYSNPVTKVYVNDASGNSWKYWKRFYSS